MRSTDKIIRSLAAILGAIIGAGTGTVLLALVLNAAFKPHF